jgi:tRNA(Ile)-lysidine synthase
MEEEAGHLYCRGDNVKLTDAVQRSPSTALLQQMRRTLTRSAMLTPGDRVLVAVSGGPDSVALLAALVVLSDALAIEVRAAHFNHQLRGAESRRDQQCAEVVTERLGVRCIVGDAVGLACTCNLEANAREQRYSFLTRTAAAEACTKIATGHTMDDQAETLLMRLLRGSGADGLVGIHAARDGRIVRPLLECSRQQVLAFLKAHALPFCEDSSNCDRRRLRNRVRHDVLPLLRSINPDVVRTLASAAEILAGETRLLEADARARLPAGAAGLPVAVIVAAPPALRGRMVRAWLRQRRGDLRRLSAAHVRAVVDLALGQRPSASARLPGGERVARQYDELRWDRNEPPPVDERCQELVAGSAVSLTSGWCIRAELVEPPPPPRPADLWEVTADAAVVLTPLLVRSARPGDRVRPLGMRGHRKLQDIFVDRKLPRADRWSVPVVEAAGEILWVPGVVRSGAALITAATRSSLRLVAQKTGIAGR